MIPTTIHGMNALTSSQRCRKAFGAALRDKPVSRHIA